MNVGATKYLASLGGQSKPAIANGEFMTQYLGTTISPGVSHSSTGLPDEAILKDPDDVEVERVISWNGPCWQQMPGLYDFDVETLDVDGVTWNTEVTVTRSASRTGSVTAM